MIKASFLHGVSRGHIDCESAPIPAAWIVEGATTDTVGSLIIERAIINDEIDIHGATISKSITFRNCFFASCDFENVEFQKSIIFSDCIFWNDLSFYASHFRYALVISSCEFANSLSLSSVAVDYNILISNVRIAGNLNAQSAIVRARLVLREIVVRGEMHLEAADVATLTATRLTVGDLSMHTAKVTYFDTTRLIARSIRAHYLIVGSALHLPGAVIIETVDLMGSHVAGTINVANSTIKGDLDLSASEFKNLRGHGLYAVGELRCIYGKFDGIELNRASVGRLTIRNSECRGSITIYGLSSKSGIAIEACRIGGWISTAISGDERIGRGILGDPLDESVRQASAMTLVEGPLSFGALKVGIQIQLINVYSTNRLVGSGITTTDILIMDCIFSEIVATGLRASNSFMIDRVIANGDVSLPSLSVGSAASVTRSRLGSVDMTNAATGFLTFVGSTFETLALRQATISGAVHLDRCRVKHTLGLRNANIDELFFTSANDTDGIEFPDEFDMVGTQYAVLHANFPKMITALRRTYPIRLEPLDELARYLRASGQPDVADDAFQAGREAQMLYYDSPLSAIWADFRSIFSGFGVKPGRYAYGYAIGFCIAFLAGFTPGGLAAIGHADRPVMVDSVSKRINIACALAVREGLPYVTKAQSGYVFSQSHGAELPLSSNEVAGVGRLFELFFGSLLIASLAGILRPAGGLK